MIAGFLNHQNEWYCWWFRVLHQLIWYISHYLQGFIHPSCCFKEAQAQALSPYVLRHAESLEAQIYAYIHFCVQSYIHTSIHSFVHSFIYWFIMIYISIHLYNTYMIYDIHLDTQFTLLLFLLVISMISLHITTYHVMSYHIKSYHIISNNIKAYQIISNQVILCDTTLHSYDVVLILYYDILRSIIYCIT